MAEVTTVRLSDTDREHLEDIARRCEQSASEIAVSDRKARRDHFYGMALAGMLANSGPNSPTFREAREAAEAFMRESEIMAAADRANAAEEGKGEM